MTRALTISTGLLLAAVVAMGVYLHILRGNERERAQNVPDSRPISAPVAGPAARVTFYLAYDDPGVVRAQEASIALPADPAQRGREILHALLGEYVKRPSSHELPAGADVKDVFLVNGNTAVVDTTPAFAEGHRSGVFVETLTVASLVKTLTANLPGVSRVKILVDGKERETLAGHADLECFYDVVTVEQLLQQLR
ncbi:MAG TPA: GerMN domain-containing protein [Terriglobales bacterium]|nr:GerMN domain-containing protein [Terriglobales bacterium]